MNPTEYISLLFCGFAVGAAAFATVRYDMQMLQQNSYFNDRYIKWLRSSNELNTIKRFCLLIAAVLFAVFDGHYFVLPLLALLPIGVAVNVFRQKQKIPLKYTPRVRRMMGVELALMAIMAVAIGCIFGAAYGLGTALLLSFLSMFVTMGVNILMRPVEQHITNGFIVQARRRLADMPHLKIIGITGSYGKTSTKNYLTRMLREKYNVCVTPGNFNTTLGVVRTINEYLQPYDEVFVCEMGAKQAGDIREICELVHPTVGIITAVGPMHLDTFGDINGVRRTKFELADALPTDGVLVLNNDFEPIAAQPVDNVATVWRYAVANPADTQFHAEDITYSPRGTTFTIVGPDIRLSLTTRLVGEGNISNLIAATIVALHLGVSPQDVARAVAHIEQVEHRLSIKRSAAGVTIIDDAYNSNPVGSRMALDVLTRMPGQRFIVTPGMVELGDRQDELNRQFGEHIARTADVAIIVGKTNRAAIVAGIQSTGIAEDKLHTVDTLDQAQALLQTLVHSGDTVLYENDLPDTFK